MLPSVIALALLLSAARIRVAPAVVPDLVARSGERVPPVDPE